MILKTFDIFVLESETVKLDKNLREYVLTHMKDAIFNLRSENFYKEFSVTPYKQETIESLKNAHLDLDKALSTLNVQDMYSAVIKAYMIPYTYGNVFSSKFSLSTVPDLSLTLDPNQQRTLVNSEKEFLMNEFSSLNKRVKDSVIEALRERSEIICAVIEALFYYIRTIDKENFYDGMSVDEIVETYEEAIKKASKEASFSYEGPFSDAEKTDLSVTSTTAFWLCEKDRKPFIVQATVSPSDLRSEENVGGTKGLKMSLTIIDEKLPDKDYNFFNLEELPARIKLFNDKILKKK